LVDYADVIEINGKLYLSFFESDYNRLFIMESDGTEFGSRKIYDKSGSRYYMTSNLLGKEGALVFCGANNNDGTSLIKLNLEDYTVNYVKELQDKSEKPFIFLKYTDLCTLDDLRDGRIFCSSPTGSYSKKGWISRLDESTTYNIERLNEVMSIFNFGNYFYFSKNSVLEGSELWKSDGTNENTFLSDNINQSKYGFSTFNQTPSRLNNKLIFSASDKTNGEELWMYNSATGVTLLKDILPGSASSYPGNFTVWNEEIYFAAYDDSYAYELWKTDGADTKIVRDVAKDPDLSYSQYLTPHKNNLYFVTRKENHYHLCSTDGIGIKFIKDLGENMYGVPVRVNEMNSSGDFIYFVTDSSGKDLWLSDGTEAGTYKLKDFISCSNLTDVNGKLFFTASETYNGEEELWVTEGTEAETSLVINIGDGYSSNPNDLINFNGVLFFTAHRNESGREVWKSDGSENGTIELIDINSGSQSSIKKGGFCIMGNNLYFSANNGTDGFELWKTDGFKSGTSLVKDINSGYEGSFPAQFTVIENVLYFQAYDNEHGIELWKTDGTELGTLLVSDILPGNLSSSPSNMVSIDNDVFFMAESIVNGRQIWKIPYNTVTSTPEIITDSEITVFPNPCVDFLYFNTNSKTENISVYNSNGQTMVIENTQNNSIDLSQLTAGIYIVKFDVEGETITKIIIKK